MLASPVAGIVLVLALAWVALGLACATAPVASPSSQDTGNAVTLTLPPEPGQADPGVYDDRIVFGQSAAFSGPARHLGTEMRLGILAAFREANQVGGVHGRRMELESLDDGYESDAAFANTQRLIYESDVFALIGAVGTPTSRSSFLSADYAGAPFIAPFTGAEFLRNPELDNVLNLRASYYQETEEMVARLTEDLGIRRVAVFYQNDAYGQAGLEGTRLALERRRLEPVASGHYERNTTAVHGAVFHIVDADPEAVVLIGAYAPVANTITEIRQSIDPVFMAISFVGGAALARELGPEGEGVYVTRLCPFPKMPASPRSPDTGPRWWSTIPTQFQGSFRWRATWLAVWPSPDWKRAAASSAASVSSTPSAMSVQLTLMGLSSSTVTRTTKGPIQCS